ncbi:ABC transporter ATP-binding protein [Thermodesulfovibrio yellowstonii]|uniref:Iron ABC transporter ATP-binding protein n=1 Tax=Thermodesulfovibrio yellowstonii TaxID=28262 RepID=A0A9W6GE91_9BACT|nr:ABC transporter ATP-binding protein [Thermodesulfovibrio islandicus]GLI53694.1 iron ABC transporter ATP-binding protein [Thermodesulfovibrio islandicus]
MLKIENVFSGYGEKEVLKGIKTEFRRGRFYAILGPNGSGKSTLLRTFAKILKPKRGTVLLDNRDIKNLSAKEIAKKIAYLPQMSNSVPHSTVFDSVLLGRKPHVFFEPTKRDLEIVEKIIHELGLTQHALRKIDELSGGEAQKVLIARALAQEPEVLLLDEPVNHLDPKNQIEILWLLKKTTNDFKIATIVVLHDINLAIQFADYFIFMKNGEIYREGDLDVIGDVLIRDVYNIDVKIIEVNGSKFVIMKS